MRSVFFGEHRLHWRPYTEADISNYWASAPKPACCTSALEGAAFIIEVQRALPAGKANCAKTI
jgi:hypothetical protein